MNSTPSRQWWHCLLLLLLCSLWCADTAGAQVFDPDNCWTCRDSQQHAIAGAVIDQAAALAFRKPWQRVSATVVVGVVFEVGQWDAARGKAGQLGYGVSLKDIGCDIIGALAREAVWALFKRRR